MNREPQLVPSVSMVLGVPIDVVDMSGALDRIVELVAIGRSTGQHHQVVTVNVDFLVNGATDPGVRSILCRADLAIADGMPVVWASRLFGVPLPERVAGADLVGLLAGRAADEGMSMLLFGGRPGIAERAADHLRSEYPALRVEGMECPPIDDPEDTDVAVIEAVRAVGADIVCVALGHPKQDRWIAAHGAAVGPAVMIGVGGTLDFITGEVDRAPERWQRSGTEWIYRLSQEPRRLAKRYLRDLVQFGPRIVVERLDLLRFAPLRQMDRRSSLDTVPASVAAQDPAEVLVTTLGSLLGVRRFDAPVVVVVDGTRLPPPGWSTLSDLVGAARHLREQGGELVVAMGSTGARQRWWSRQLAPHLVLFPDRQAALSWSAARTTG